MTMKDNELSTCSSIRVVLSVEIVGFALRLLGKCMQAGCNRNARSFCHVDGSSPLLR